MKGSMVSGEIVEPYAEALMSLAQSQNQTERFGEDVRSLLGVLESSEDLQHFLGNPVVSAENKKAVLQQIAGDGLHPYILNFLMLLVERRRILFLEGICKQFQALLRKLNQTVLAEVISAVELSEAQQQAIGEKVKAISGAQQVELDTKLDPDLIGGVIIKVGSQVLDASLRGQLRRIGIRLNSAA
ncbi:F0F1 ATP synthase subunit delta [Coleofasciculus sp. FACHB-712]|uniref:ATP synthase F1 subunit delta n=1 Tax=Cyanophyceae TaxID=3028117 RepID=UPI0016869C58|nr:MULTISPECIES: ATP synthase F1 subunit delta [unclassified Coleofasciculus]MBD1888211.1 F0F1 ATP synthase subunit delta [Coleofasciculus sp. FACHB-SPT9]MBD1941315.1 F0F1 ATP synthase subunit delta [Coleofasciculus sp. FACHB-712]